MSGSITRDGEFIVIRIPESEVHGLRVALVPCPCPCRAPKSQSTADIRARLERGLARAYFTKNPEPQGGR